MKLKTKIWCFPLRLLLTRLYMNIVEADDEVDDPGLLEAADCLSTIFVNLCFTILSLFLVGHIKAMLTVY
ncbi:hypothetical protein HanRHA438_Chr16g0751641 [Helianthus annuus]|nr:hypothetical protein HanRHA438_Chr16g0751641 [Helianthus annuus]